MSMRKTPRATQAPVNVVGSSIFGRYNKISAERTYNLFISDDWLVNFAGFKKVAEIFALGTGRGVFRSVRGGFILAVFNSSVVRLDLNFSPTFIGTLDSSSGDVFMDENLNSQICIVDGVNAYIYNYSIGVNLTVQTLASGLVPSYVCYHNTFFLIGNSNNTTSGAGWYSYNYASATTIGTPQMMALQTKPDYAIAIRRIPGQGNNVLVFGRTVCEIHTQVQNVNQATGVSIPYLRNSTINVDYGCASVATIAASDEFIAWLGVNESNGPVIMVYSGQGAAPISTDGIDYVLDQLKYPEQSTALFFRQDGHLFYQLTFYNSADNLTLIYDFTTQKFFHLTDWDLNYHPATSVVYFNGSSYFVSLNDASVYEMSTNFTTYDDNIVAPSSVDYDEKMNHEIPRIRICKSVRAENSRRFIANSLVITIEQGQDPGFNLLDIPQPDYIVEEETYRLTLDEDNINYIVKEGSYMGDPMMGLASMPLFYLPRVDLSLSYDGGTTYGTYVGRDLNPQGYRKNILSWEKMGAANDLILKFRFVGTGRVVVNDAIMDIY